MHWPPGLSAGGAWRGRRGLEGQEKAVGDPQSQALILTLIVLGSESLVVNFVTRRGLLPALSRCQVESTASGNAGRAQKKEKEAQERPQPAASPQPAQGRGPALGLTCHHPRKFKTP